MTSAVDEIISKLAGLSPEDLDKVRKCLAILATGKATGPEGPDDEDEKMLLSAMRDELRSRGVRAFIKYSEFVETKQYKAWLKGVKVSTTFLNRSFSDQIKTKSMRLGMMRILFKVLIEDLQDRGLPVSMGVVAANLQHVQVSFDKQFPGYLEAGLGYLIPDAMRKKR